MKYHPNYVEPGDYVKLNLCDDWYKITGKDGYYIDLVDNFGSPTGAHISDIEDLKLPSEMDYNF